MNNRVKLFLEEMSIHSDYELLDYGKNKNEMDEIAKKRGLKLPSKDVAMFKCKYAFVDETNLNGCSLPKKEVEKALDSLNLKAVDKDHFRQSAVGMWLDAKLVNNDIVAYGGFWKSNFPEEYEEVKKRMKEGKMKISFEAWGDRKFKTDGTYDLTNIEFAGGALLFDTEPAFPNAEVMEFSNRVLEFAKVIEEAKKKIKCKSCQEEFDWEDEGKDKQKCSKCGKEVNKDGEVGCEAVSPRKTIKIISEETYSTIEIPNDSGYDVQVEKRFKKTYFYDDNTQETTESNSIGVDKFSKAEVDEMIKLSSEEINEDFEETISSLLEGEELIDEDNKIVEDSKKLTYKERKNINDDLFAVVVTVKNKVTGKPRKIRMFPIQDPAHVRNALARLPQAVETLKKLGISVDTVKNKILKRARELNMTDLLKRHKEEANNFMDELLTKYSKASVEELVKFLDTELDTIKATVTTKEQELATKLQELTVKDTELATLKTEKESISRLVEESKLSADNVKLELETLKANYATLKAELDSKKTAETASEIKSRKDLLGDYAKDMSDEDILNELKFENAKLRKERDEAVTKAGKKGLDAGSVLEIEDETTTKRKNIQEKAWIKK